jgi:hypothetical protein
MGCMGCMARGERKELRVLSRKCITGGRKVEINSRIGKGGLLY